MKPFDRSLNRALKFKYFRVYSGHNDLVRKTITVIKICITCPAKVGNSGSCPLIEFDLLAKVQF